MRRLSVILSIVQMVAKSPGTEYTYESVKSSLNLPVEQENSIFRKYDVRGSKLRYLKEVDLDTYVDYLQQSLSTNDDKV